MATTQPTSTLADRINHQAAGMYPAEAAAMILTEAVQGTLPDKLAAAIDDDLDRDMAFVDWAAAVEISGPFSRGERQLIALAASLADSEIPIIANDIFYGLDRTNAAIVLEALAHSFGGWTLAEMTEPQ